MGPKDVIEGLLGGITRSITFPGYRSSHLSPIKGCVWPTIIDEVGYLPITREFRPGYRPIPNSLGRIDVRHVPSFAGWNGFVRGHLQ